MATPDGPERRDGMGDDALVDEFIGPNPYRSGAAEAVIVGFGVSVWAMVGYLRWANFDVEATARAYKLPEAAVRAALAHYEHHRCEIDSRIASNTILVPAG
jgi:uncharacterized protein (DUF433 family)